MAAFGGLRILEIDREGKVKVRVAEVDDFTADELNRNLVMFYTGTTRSADKILSEQTRGAQKDEKAVVESLHNIKEIGYKVLEAVESGNITDVGLLFDEHWRHKKRMSRDMTTPWLDEVYELAKANGALGGKITGAGGGGFFLFYTEKDHGRLQEAMKKAGLREMRYRFFNEGTKVLVNLISGIR
jgi:D-glycero-alpha-D-manno-heptose-7-phosphate kinase